MTSDVVDQTRRAFENYSALPSVRIGDGVPPSELYLATPDRTAYALGWIVANAIVEARFLQTGIDAIPIYHPENGWDRFLLTRRASCRLLESETANRFGMLMLSGDDPPRLTSASGDTVISLGTMLREDPQRAVSLAVGSIATPELPAGKHGRCAHQRAVSYSWYFNVVTDLILDHPGLTAAREIYVDADEIDGTFHPLYLHAITLRPMSPDDRHGFIMPDYLYDWFQLQLGDEFAFFNIYGERVVYRSIRGTWSSVRRSLKSEPPERVRARIASWLWLEGEPDPEID